MVKSAQDFVPIKEIRDGVVVLKDGSMRSILMVSSVNFALKSSDEQKAILIRFQNFLNALEFSTQIFIQSRKLDIRPYIAMMEERRKEQTNELIRIQTREYIEFIKNFTTNVNIMSKNFFIVVPYSPAIVPTKKKMRQILSGQKQGTKKEESSDFLEQKTQLEQRLGIVEQGLSGSGLRVVKLGTEETIELLYKIFNPGESEKPIQLNG
ncbi:TraC family protein [Patescibacteria group bacterium]